MMFARLAPYRKAVAAAVGSYVGTVLVALAVVADDGITLAELLAALAVPFGVSAVSAGATYTARANRPKLPPPGEL